MKTLLLTFSAFLLSTVAQAGEIIKVADGGRMVAISDDGSQPWEMREKVCVYRSRRKLACGRISRVFDSGAVVKLRRHRAELEAGDSVRRYESRSRKRRRSYRVASREPTSIGPAEELMESAEPSKAAKNNDGLNNFTGGVNGTPGLAFPMVHYQRVFGKNWALGLAPGLLSSTSPDGDAKIGAYGVQASINYYSKGNFQGFWGMVSGGPYFFTITADDTDESSMSIFGSATIGWRQQVGGGVNLGIAAGGQYTTLPQSELVDVEFSALRPMIMVDAGFSF